MDTTSRTTFAETTRPVDGLGDQRRAELLLVVVALIWALNYPFVKWALGTVNEFVFNAIRYPLAAGFVALLFPFISKWQPVRPGDWRRLIGVGLLANVVYQSTFIVGLSLTTAGNSAIIFSTCPLWTALWSMLLHKENVRRSMWAGMAISVVGVGLIIGGSGQQIRLGSHGIWGDLLTLAASAIWALNTNVQKPMVAVYSPIQVNVIALGQTQCVRGHVGDVELLREPLARRPRHAARRHHLRLRDLGLGEPRAALGDPFEGEERPGVPTAADRCVDDHSGRHRLEQLGDLTDHDGPMAEALGTPRHGCLS
jgi:uncharacterized membrane protein